MISQDVTDETVYRKRDDCRSVHHFIGEEIHFDSIDFTIAVEDIYQRVQNEDMQTYLAEQNAADPE
ncbi:hypothetical protein [Pseudoalteromonas rubra]|uniref:hypothetical protein n=1 Tax=Pseudoalteromonas rubra TaxID=43658 RepID=UPI002DBA0765|nr:hypothetical protein [Pseudoalteromonas rubra]MEC4090893.1 hypothetical protein [Pseudoalteromonas rubra]